jgi:hypothetical protein
VLAISVLGSGSGTVTSDPAGIDCGAPCAGVYAKGTTVTLTAKPGAESRFAGWTGCDGASAGRCIVTLASARAVGVIFEEAASLKLGSISLDGAGGTLRASVPGPGILSVSAGKLRPAKVAVKRAGTVTLPVILNKAGRRALARKGRLRVELEVVFRASDGAPARGLSKVLTFRDRSRKR